MNVFVENTVEPDRNNVEGYYESKEVVGINDRILSRFGGPWPNFYSMDTGWENDRALDYLVSRCEEFVGRMQVHESWCLKDPRLSLTLPLWKRIIPADRCIIFCVRNPLSVARSLAAAAGTSIATGSKLWFSTTLWAIKNVTSEDVMVTHYEDFVKDPVNETDRISEFVGKAKLKNGTRVVSRSLKHHDAGVEELFNHVELDWETKLLYFLIRDSKSRPESFNTLGDLLHFENIESSGRLKNAARLVELEKEAKKYKKLYRDLKGHLSVRIESGAKSALAKFQRKPRKIDTTRAEDRDG